MLVVFIWPNILLCAPCRETHKWKEMWNAAPGNCDWGDFEASQRGTDCNSGLREKKKKSRPDKLYQIEERCGGIWLQIVYSLFICNVYSSASRLSTGGKKTNVVAIWFLLLQCTIVYSVCGKLNKTTKQTKKKKQSHLNIVLRLLFWYDGNVTVQFDLCILKIHSFLLLYIYMCPCMFVQKKENKCLFFIFVTACLKKRKIT